MDQKTDRQAETSNKKTLRKMKSGTKRAFGLALYLLSTTTLLASSTSGLVGANESRVRVLLLQNATKQRAVDEAASLSIDLPVGERASDSSAPVSSETSQGGSLGYQTTSLASLRLHQRSSRDLNNQTPDSANESTQSQQVPNAPQSPDPWTELYLPRIRPSWLEVGDQFKINGSNIEDVKYMMPIEYLIRPAFDSPILLKTKLGILEGVRSIRFNKHIYTFLSVPYAKPPVGDLRFKAPQPVEKWDGILQSTKWPPFCIQPSMTLSSKSSPVHVLSQMMTEDCLYLNIWTPSLKFNKSRKRPVMVWIHGGAFQYGGISVDENDGSALSILGDVVVVTLNYRISAFGFLNANNKLNGPNNVGLLDQQMALEWVQSNIKQFGGDPNQVTLFGESAGGHSVGLHMISPKSQRLFKRAILQSGVPISVLRSYDVNSDNKGTTVGEGVSSYMMAKRLKCYVPNVEHMLNETASPADQPETTLVSESGENMTTTEASSFEADAGTEFEVDVTLLNDATLECMRKKSSLDILKAMGTPGNSGFFPTGNDLNGFFPHGPIVDSFNPDNLSVGPQKDYLIGTNTDEGAFMLHYGIPSVFPSKGPPRVDSVDSLKAALMEEISRLAKISALSQNSSEIQSASGEHRGGGGAQAHLYKPLLKTSTSILESFMPKSHVHVLENGTVVDNTTKYSKEVEFGKNIASFITDIIFLCPARTLARTLAEAGRNVYFYLYAHRSSLSQYHEWMGVTHHDEVEFVFGRPLRLADVYSGKDIEMSQSIIKTWSHFAYTGHMLDRFNVKWPKYDPEENYYMTLETERASVGSRYHDKVCNVYDTVISVHLQDN